MGVKNLFIIITFIYACSSLSVLNIIENKKFDFKNDTEDRDSLSKSKIFHNIKNIRKNKLLFKIVVISIFINFAVSPFDLILTAHVKEFFKAGAATYSLMDGSLMFGMIFGSLVVGYIIQKIQIKNTLVSSFFFLGTMLVLIGVVNNLILAVILSAFSGFLIALIDSSLDSYLLRIVPDKNRNSIFATLTSLFTMFVPLSSGVFALLLNNLYTSNIFIVLGIIIYISTIVFLFSIKNGGLKNNV